MKATLKVCGEEEIDIPDLSPQLVDVTINFGARIIMYVNIDEYVDGGDFAELYVELTDAENESDQGAYETALAATPDYDESKMSGDNPFFQSDGPDGEEVFEKYITLMKERYPKALFA